MTILSVACYIYAVVTTLSLIGVYLLTRLFGLAELMLVKNRVVTGFVSFLHLPPNGQARHSEIHLQGSADWGELWGKLTESASKLDLKMIRLDVNVPAIYEGYHAIWHYPNDDGMEDTDVWRAEIP